MAVLVAITACRYPALPNFDDATPAGPPDAQACYGTLSFDRVCFTVVPTAPVMMTASAQINTDDPSMCDQHNDQVAKYCVFAGSGFTLPAGITIRAYGSKPLVLISTTMMFIAGTVDVSSNHNPGATNIGAAANPAGMCTGTTAATGNSGGFGGTFGGQGGDGQNRDGAGGGAAVPLASFPTTLRGGCPGGAGSTNIGGATAGAGESGGGAVALIAGTSITVNGTINASGAGGLGGSANRSGGGGGGAGGMIVLDAPSIATAASGRLYANGGGGAEGGAGATGGTPAVGSPGGESTGPTMPASKGGTTNDGGDGGDGSSGGAPSGANAAGQAMNDGGGGAGGGGAGVIHAPGITTNIAPPSTNPS